MNIPNDFYDKNIDFIDLIMDNDGILHGKSKMIDRLGFLPSTIWKPDKNITLILKDIIGDKSQCRKSLDANKSHRRNGVNNSKPSVFNPHLTQMILAAYCSNKSNIYDPFAGGGTRGYVSNKMGHNYFGVELRKEEVERINNMFNKWNLKFNIINENSINYIPKKEGFDFSFTCPPYYNLERYSNLDNDLSNYKDYNLFLRDIRKVLKNTFYSLKPNSFCVWVVGNFRNKEGEMTHLNGDIVKLAKDVGFKFWDEIIWNGASSVALTRSGQFLSNRKAVRIHEYILIFKKQ